MNMENTTRFGRLIQARSDPLLLYFLVRLITCVPAAAILLTQNAAEEAPRFGLGLLVYAFVLSLAVAMAYTVILRSRWTLGWRDATNRRIVITAIALGLIDVAAGLWAIFSSGGGSSPYWLVSLASLIVPCVLFGLWISLGIASVYALMHAAVIYMANEGGAGVWLGSQSHIHVGSAITVFLVCLATGYLGDMLSESNENKRRKEAALRNLGTMLEITQRVASGMSDVNDLMCRVAQTIGERHQYDVVAIYLSEPGQPELQLSGWLGELDDYEEYARKNDRFLRRAIATQDSLLMQGDKSWRAAYPLRSRDSRLGVLVDLLRAVERTR